MIDWGFVLQIIIFGFILVFAILLALALIMYIIKKYLRTERRMFLLKWGTDQLPKQGDESFG